MPSTRKKWTANSMIGPPNSASAALNRSPLMRSSQLAPAVASLRASRLAPSTLSRPSFRRREQRSARRTISAFLVCPHSHLICPIVPSPNSDTSRLPRPTCSVTEFSFWPYVTKKKNTATIRDIVRHDGFRGLYRGLGPTILGYLPTWAIYFAVYDGIKTLFGEAPLGLDALVAKSERLYPAPSAKGYQPIVREHPWSLHILSAMVAGAASTICTNPFWVIKTRFMVCVLQLVSVSSSSPWRGGGV